MLVHYLESFTDSLVVTDEENEPIGVMGGYEIIRNVFENPSADLFEQKTVRDIMDDELLQMTPQTTLKELLEKWQQTRRAFCILPNQYGGYSAISARKLLEIGSNCKTSLTVSDLPHKEIVRFMSDNTIGEIIHMMIENCTRKLVFEDFQGFISDRTIIQTIAQDLHYLKNTENFLDLKYDLPFMLADIVPISKDLNLADLSKLMFGMMHPYVSAEDQVYTPWDVCIALLSEDVRYPNITIDH